MSTLGALGTPEDRTIYRMYVNEVTKRLRPKNIAVYGDVSKDIFAAAFEAGVNVVSYPTNFSQTHPKKVD